MSDSASERIRVVVVDDEELARGILREWLASHAGIEIVAECANGFEAVKAATELKPDLLMLDIQMPKIDGFDVLELIGGDIPVIFITAYESYAVRAFEVHAVDYLLKPFSAERLADALDRARERIRSRDLPPVKDLLAAARTGRTPIERILIRERSEVHVIPVQKIDYIVTGRLRRRQVRRAELSQGTTARRARGGLGPCGVRAHSSPLRAEFGPAGENRDGGHR
jgi:two-component system, LytTR family, response regulator